MERRNFMISRVEDPGSSPGLLPRCFFAIINIAILEAVPESAACDVFRGG
jgi:hypothetical protein